MTQVNGRRDNGDGVISNHPDRDLWHGKIRVSGKRVDVYGKNRGEVRDKMREAKRLAKAEIAQSLWLPFKSLLLGATYLRGPGSVSGSGGGGLHASGS